MVAHHPHRSTLETEATQSDWVRDHSTEQAEVRYVTMPLGGYLTSLGIFDQAKREVNFVASNVATSVQRNEIRIQSEPIKIKMLETIWQGGILPARTLEERDGGYMILDGLQRTSVESRALQWLINWYEDKKGTIPTFAQDMMANLGPKLLSVEDFLARPVFLQVWRKLTKSESTRKFLALNLGQIKVTNRHIMEALNVGLEDQFKEWGFETVTEKETKAHKDLLLDEQEAQQAKGGKPGRKKKGETADITDAGRPASDEPETETVYRFDLMINALRAYVDKDPWVRTKSSMQELYAGEDHELVEMSDHIVEKMESIGVDTVHDDFQWVFRDLHNGISRVYAGKARWENVILNSDNFVIALVAALAQQRHDFPTKTTENQAALIDILQNTESGVDVLEFGIDKKNLDPESLYGIYHQLAATKHADMIRNLVYQAALDFFRSEPTEGGVVFRWNVANNTITNATRRKKEEKKQTKQLKVVS